MNPCGHIKLTDFGFAVNDTEKSHIISGTPEYMSPEKLLNEDDGLESDYWSFGVILYEMLTGDPPFFDRDTNRIYKKILDSKFIIPPYISVLAGDLIKKLLKMIPPIQPKKYLSSDYEYVEESEEDESIYLNEVIDKPYEYLKKFK